MKAQKNTWTIGGNGHEVVVTTQVLADIASDGADNRTPNEVRARMSAMVTLMRMLEAESASPVVLPS